ncbi:MAG: hypothetical protein WA324_02140 [Bryobacteraceae bacterium]
MNNSQKVRKVMLSVFIFTTLAVVIHAQTPAVPATAAVPAEHEGQHDFDFELGTWKTHLKVLRHPPKGAPTWVEYEGTSVVHSIWEGRANMVELKVDGPSGHLEAINLHLYNPTAHQWSLNFANATQGTMSVPTVGEFKNGRGEFYDQEAVNGRMILVRNVWSEITANRCHFEQAFSDDGGRTWETNWIADDTRISNSKATPASW